MKPLTKSQFRWLLVVYFGVVVSSFVVDSITKPIIPESVVHAQRASDRELFSKLESPGNIVVPLALVGVLVLAVVGLVGMFLLWRPGFYMFLVAVCIRTIGPPPLLGAWYVHTGWSNMFTELGLLLEGVIFAVVFFGPAKHLFQRSDANLAAGRS